MRKCIASVNGECSNKYGFICGIKCNGYSDNCSLKKSYDKIETAYRVIQKSLSNALGIKGDVE